MRWKGVMRQRVSDPTGVRAWERRASEVHTATATPKDGRRSYREADVTTSLRADTALAGLPARPAWLTTRFTGLGFIDREGTTLELLALEPLDGGFRRGAVGHLDESKAFGAAGVAVDNDTDLVHNAIRLKELAKVMVGGGKRQIANINIHRRFLVGNGAHNRQVIRTVCKSKM
jgi:hypothetical protein